MCHEDGRHADEDGRHVVKEVNLFWNIQACGNIRLLQTILQEFNFFTLSVIPTFFVTNMLSFLISSRSLSANCQRISIKRMKMSHGIRSKFSLK